MKHTKRIFAITAAALMLHTAAYANEAKFVFGKGLFEILRPKPAKDNVIETVVTQNADEFTAQNGTLSATENTPVSGSLNSTVPGLGVVVFAVVTPPTKGSVVIDDAMTGDFTYTPYQDQTGEDSFVFSASNETHGEKTATVTITIAPSGAASPEPSPTATPEGSPEPEESPGPEESPTPFESPAPTPTATPSFTFKYEDMLGHWGEYSAAILAERDVLKGFEIKDKYFFYPEVELTRGDFILYLVSAMGIDVEPYREIASPFTDAEETPAWMNLQAKAAYDAGIIKGSAESGGLYLKASELLTRIEAIAMLNNTIRPDAVSVDLPTYTDMYLVPDWGVVYIKNMTAYGLMKGYDDNTVRPFAKITRAQAAEIILQTLKYKEEHPEVAKELKAEMDKSMTY